MIVELYYVQFMKETSFKFFYIPRNFDQYPTILNKIKLIRTLFLFQCCFYVNASVYVSLN